MIQQQGGPRPADTGAAPEIDAAKNTTRSNAVDETAVGELRKETALDVLRARNAARIVQAQRALLSLLLNQGSATIDDVRDELGLSGETNAKWLGAVPGDLRRAGIIRRADYAESRRAIAHARPLSVWGIANDEKARAWLAAHPDAGV